MVQFFVEDINFNPPTPSKLKKWISQVVQLEGREIKELNYIFCSDTYLLSMNQNFLAHNTYTDILTFDNSDTPLYLSSDIFISIERVKENASTYKVSFDHELRRVMIHGVLHLLGYNDKSADQQTEMRIKEEAYLSL